MTLSNRSDTLIELVEGVAAAVTAQIEEALPTLPWCAELRDVVRQDLEAGIGPRRGRHTDQPSRGRARMMPSDLGYSVERWEHRGLDCAAVKHPFLGHWCGYVGLPDTHALHGLDYDQIDLERGVHGGLTYAGELETVIPDSGLWWLGFDCAHAGDLVPCRPPYPGDVFRDLDYVKAEAEDLADQLRDGAFKRLHTEWI